MQFTIETYAQKIARQQKWHKWFAWRPVGLTEDFESKHYSGKIVWLEYVERCLLPSEDLSTLFYRNAFYRFIK